MIQFSLLPYPCIQLINYFSFNEFFIHFFYKKLTYISCNSLYKLPVILYIIEFQIKINGVFSLVLFYMNQEFFSFSMDYSADYIGLRQAVFSIIECAKFGRIAVAFDVSVNSDNFLTFSIELIQNLCKVCEPFTVQLVSRE